MNDVKGKAYIVTGPTSGLGRETALRMAVHGTIVLVGRNREKLNQVRKEIEESGGRAVPVVCDMSDLESVHHAAEEIISMNLPLAGLINNAGIQSSDEGKTAAGLDNTFATNHLGPFSLADMLIPYLSDGASVLFIGSATEDPDRKPARRAGFRGGRYISAEASARGEWLSGGSVRPGMDAYATSKQCNIVAALALARENPRLRINAMEPGIMFNTGLHDDLNKFFTVAARRIVPFLAPFVKVLSTPRRAARLIDRIMTDGSRDSGIYYDEGGHPMQGSARARDTAFQDRVVAETRALLATIRS